LYLNVICAFLHRINVPLTRSVGKKALNIVIKEQYTPLKHLSC